MNNHLPEYVVIAICLAGLLAWLVGFAWMWVRALLERSALNSPHIQTYDPTSQPTVSGTAFAFRAVNRITYHNGQGTSFLVRAVRKEDITGGEGYFFPYHVQMLERGLFHVWSVQTRPTPSLTKWIEVRGAYRFVPVAMDDEGDEVEFIQEIK